MSRTLLVVAIVASFFLACEQKTAGDPLKKALSSEDVRIKRVIDNLDQYEVQIRYTQIDRYGDSLNFTDYDFQVNVGTYFYPASTVKFPAAVVALEKLNEIDSVHRDTRFYIEGDSIETSFSEAILQIFAVSDNAANNRLIEFLGFDDLNQRLKKRGVAPIRISHRLSVKNGDDVTTKPLIIYTNDSTTVTSNPIVNNVPVALKLMGIKKGKGFYAQDSLYQEPFDFGLKNYYPIKAQHALLKRIIFPEQFSEEERFDLTNDQHHFLLNAMQILPKEADYQKEKYYDSYGKFFIYGDSEEPLPDYINIYNKVGYAYGTLTDCAYIKDTKNNVDFMLTATILVNKDEIFNDDLYEYDEVGIPFLAQLGRELYEYELKRKK
ncbi:serine hydrolase [Allomuricauda sp. SCSIO 65647]|uniref:serine hydrolase n=1 Tax=Allomuricauda sp. SCSIO 65647 TaxID=2908843 RepID=UPI001F39244D|nr:serine hydrolase [Muricauda sp. SCSIO 65647]UJH67993.1 class A beta-lactamase-related serine hydrolase [Muricauda sp. SCSIO 65647]